jgi:hypothetical protein
MRLLPCRTDSIFFFSVGRLCYPVRVWRVQVAELTAALAQQQEDTRAARDAHTKATETVHSLQQQLRVSTEEARSAKARVQELEQQVRVAVRPVQQRRAEEAVAKGAAEADALRARVAELQTALVFQIAPFLMCYSCSDGAMQTETETKLRRTAEEKDAAIHELQQKLSTQSTDRRARIQHLEETVTMLSRKGEYYQDLARLSRDCGMLKLSETRLKAEVAFLKQRYVSLVRQHRCVLIALSSFQL